LASATILSVDTCPDAPCSGGPIAYNLNYQLVGITTRELDDALAFSTSRFPGAVELLVDPPNGLECSVDPPTGVTVAPWEDAPHDPVEITGQLQDVALSQACAICHVVSQDKVSIAVSEAVLSVSGVRNLQGVTSFQGCPGIAACPQGAKSGSEPSTPVALAQVRSKTTFIVNFASQVLVYTADEQTAIITALNATTSVFGQRLSEYLTADANEILSEPIASLPAASAIHAYVRQDVSPRTVKEHAWVQLVGSFETADKNPKICKKQYLSMFSSTAEDAVDDLASLQCWPREVRNTGCRPRKTLYIDSPQRQHESTEVETTVTLECEDNYDAAVVVSTIRYYNETFWNDWAEKLTDLGLNLSIYNASSHVSRVLAAYTRPPRRAWIVGPVLAALLTVGLLVGLLVR